MKYLFNDEIEAAEAEKFSKLDLYKLWKEAEEWKEYYHDNYLKAVNRLNEHLVREFLDLRG